MVLNGIVGFFIAREGLSVIYLTNFFCIWFGEL